MKHLRRNFRWRNLFITVTAVAMIAMGALADVVSDRLLLPRYFPHPLAQGEHLKKVNSQGKTPVLLVDRTGAERVVGELEGRSKTKYSTVSALLSASFVLPTAILLFLGWPRVPLLNHERKLNHAA